VENAVMALGDYNATAKQPLHLVLSRDAVEHVARVTRLLLSPQGNALLVGAGGSGRKSLCTLAAHVVGYTLDTIELSKSYGTADWQEDLKRMLLRAGRDGKPLVFMLADTQIVKESFLEDVNNILNKGEAPGLFPPDEKAALVGDMQIVARKAGLGVVSPNDALALFAARVRANLHIVLCMSPVGEAFRRRLRMFPSLVNCAAIDWFHPWPAETLRGVAAHLLEPVTLGEFEHLRAGAIDTCVAMQESMAALSAKFLREARRRYYVTPASYLELLATFITLFDARRSAVTTAHARYANGIAKLQATEATVSTMQVELTELQPKLVVASGETTAMIQRIEVVSGEVEAKAVVVAAEEAVCSAQAAEAKAMKDDCEAQLAEAVPVLQSAVAAVAALSKADIVEVKTLKKPPDGVRITMEAVAIMFGLPPKKVTPPEGGPKINDYWEVAQKELLGDPRLVERLKNFAADDIPAATITKITPYVERPDFAVETIRSASVAAGGLAKWVHAIVSYDRVVKIVAPKRAALAAASATLAEAQGALASKQAELAELRAKLGALQAELATATARKESLAAEVADCATRLERAQLLVGGLGSEKTRWQASVEALTASSVRVLGDILLAAGQIAYLGAFPGAYRAEALGGWRSRVEAAGIAVSPDFTLASCLGDAVTIRAWTAAKLPNDVLSIENAIAVYKSKRWPLAIDPQRQANRWVRNLEAGTGGGGGGGLKVVRQNQTGFLRTIENAVQFGSPVLLENVGESLDPVLDPLLQRAYTKSGAALLVKLGDSVVEVHPAFRLFMTTVLPNPHYSPEVCVRVNLLNFMATMEGLTDQLLGLTARLERPELEEQRERLILSDADNKRQLKEIEDRILGLLAAASGDILNDDVLIRTLSESNTASAAISRQVEAAERTQAKISAVRAGYAPVATRGAILFFTIADLAAVDPMYQFSLQWYTRMFSLAVDKAPKAESADKRVAALLDTLSLLLYENVCRSLFEAHRSLFSAMMALRIMLGDGRLAPREALLLLQGATALAPAVPHPGAGAGGASSTFAWLSERAWVEVLEVASLPGMEGLTDAIRTAPGAWAALATADDPLGTLEPLLPDASPFRRLLVVRAMRPDKVAAALSDVVCREMGPAFAAKPAFDLRRCYDDADACTPLVFILSAGTDPMADLTKLSEAAAAAAGGGRAPPSRSAGAGGGGGGAGAGMGPCKLTSVSLGQGQGPVAERILNEAMPVGGWVCLQNCHLAPSWMPTLERIVEDLRPGSVHDSFRLWLTSMPAATFPVSVLQNGVKMTLELPKGVRAGMTAAYNGVDASWFSGGGEAGVVTDAPLHRLLFGLAFFHALVCERRRYGPQGWVIRYDYADSDFRISMDQLRAIVTAAGDGVPWDALQYLTGECNYGGRVTDDLDRRLLSTLLADVYAPRLLAVNAGDTITAASAGYCLPPASAGSLQAHLAAIGALPGVDAPQAFGLHPNAEITVAVAESAALLSTGLTIMGPSLVWAAAPARARGPPPAGGGGGGGPNNKAGGGGRRGVWRRTPSVAPPAQHDAGAAAAPPPPPVPGPAPAAAPAPAPAPAPAAVNDADVKLLEAARSVLALVPAPFDVDRVSVAFPVSYEQSLNSVLVQECMRYNGVLTTVSFTLDQVVKAVQGITVMSAELEAVASAVVQGRVPAAWKAVSYPSVKPLASWTADLAERVAFLSAWIEGGVPTVFWISGFFFTQSFLTGIRQNVARARRLPIDELVMSFRVLPSREVADVEAGSAPAVEGALVRGLFMQGASWDDATSGLTEARPRQLFSVLPILHLLPKHAPADGAAAPAHGAAAAAEYDCPVYKTSERAGTLSTTGHSTNLVMHVQLPVGAGYTAAHWVKRGTALLCQLDD